MGMSGQENETGVVPFKISYAAHGKINAKNGFVNDLAALYIRLSSESMFKVGGWYIYDSGYVALPEGIYQLVDNDMKNNMYIGFINYSAVAISEDDQIVYLLNEAIYSSEGEYQLSLFSSSDKALITFTKEIATDNALIESDKEIIFYF